MGHPADLVVVVHTIINATFLVRFRPALSQVITLCLFLSFSITTGNKGNMLKTIFKKKKKNVSSLSLSFIHLGWLSQRITREQMKWVDFNLYGTKVISSSPLVPWLCVTLTRQRMFSPNNLVYYTQQCTVQYCDPLCPTLWSKLFHSKWNQSKWINTSSAVSTSLSRKNLKLSSDYFPSALNPKTAGLI